MAEISTPEQKENVQARLLKAAFKLFLERDYNKVTTRLLAEQAKTSTYMIQYYFKDKQGLYEAMVRQQFREIGGALEDSYSDEEGLDFQKLFMSYLNIHNKNPGFPAFIIKIITYQNGPGYRLFAEILDAKRDVIKKIINQCQKNQQFGAHVDVDVIRIAMMSLSVFPFLIKGVLEKSEKMTLDEALMNKIALFSGEILQKATSTESDAIWLDLKKEEVNGITLITKK